MLFKLEKFERGISPSLHLAKEGDFARNHSATFISSINIPIPDENLSMMRYSLFLWLKYITFCHCTMGTQCIFIVKFSTIHFFGLVWLVLNAVSATWAI